MHVSQSSTVPDHCKQYALSYPSDNDFTSKCKHKHDARCDRCNIFPSVVSEISAALESVSHPEKDELKYIVENSVKQVDAWKAHLLRSTNQDQSRLDILQSLNPKSSLLVLDWAMKFLPRKYRESQTDWFGKRGISWHITVATRKNKDGEVEMLTFVHVFEKCNQDSNTVVAIVDDVSKQLTSIAPEISNIFLRQDNAGCYHSAPTLLGIRKVATKNKLQLSRVDFSDPQGGKGSCDRKAATIKNHMKIYLNSGNDIETAEQMVLAMESSGGIPGVRVTLCGPQSPVKLPAIKWDGISFLNDMEYTKNGIRVWRAYNIGKGKYIPLKKFDIPKNYVFPKVNVVTEANHAPQPCVSFCVVKARRHPKPLPDSLPSAESEQSTADDGDSDSDDESLFFCPEEGCIRSFQRFSSLQRHLDYGSHKYALEHETLYDKAVLAYAAKLEQGATAEVPEIPTAADIHLQQPLQESVLRMGWALKSTKQRKRLSEKQKKYLLDIYLIGESTGYKAEPAAVAKSMRKSKNSDGDLLFEASEFLTPQQIASFFSRLSAKRALLTADDEDEDEIEEDLREAMEEQNLDDLSKEVVNEVSIQHPIMYDTFNICDYVSQSKLEKFSISILQDICGSFQLDTSDIGQKRKRPYIELIVNLVKKCSCKSS